MSGDVLTLKDLQAAVDTLTKNNVPAPDGHYYLHVNPNTWDRYLAWQTMWEEDEIEELPYRRHRRSGGLLPEVPDTYRARLQRAELRMLRYRKRILEIDRRYSTDGKRFPSLGISV